PRGGAARELEARGPRAGPLPGQVVEAEFLQRRVERLFDELVQAMDLVDEEDVAVLLVEQHGCQRTDKIDGGAAGGLDGDAELVGDYVGQCRLAQARGPAQRDVLRRLSPAPGGLQQNAQALANLRL